MHSTRHKQRVVVQAQREVRMVPAWGTALWPDADPAHVPRNFSPSGELLPAGFLVRTPGHPTSNAAGCCLDLQLADAPERLPQIKIAAFKALPRAGLYPFGAAGFNPVHARL